MCSYFRGSQGSSQALPNRSYCINDRCQFKAIDDANRLVSVFGSNLNSPIQTALTQLRDKGEGAGYPHLRLCDILQSDIEMLSLKTLI
jgi:hypothetical protein